MGYIYSLSVDGRLRYIGQTRRTLNVRLNEHKSHCKTGYPTRVKNWIKSNINAIEIELIEDCADDDLNDREIYWISFAQSLGIDLVNLSQGGEGRNGLPLTEETKRKMSLSTSGENHWNYGKKHSAETRRKISESRKGFVMDEETKRKIANSMTGKIRKPLTEEVKKKISDSHKARWSK